MAGGNATPFFVAHNGAHAPSHSDGGPPLVTARLLNPPGQPLRSLAPLRRNYRLEIRATSGMTPAAHLVMQADRLDAAESFGRPLQRLVPLGETEPHHLGGFGFVEEG